LVLLRICVELAQEARSCDHERGCHGDPESIKKRSIFLSIVAQRCGFIFDHVILAPCFELISGASDSSFTCPLSCHPPTIASILSDAFWAVVFAVRLTHLPSLLTKLISADVSEPPVVSVKICLAFDAAAVAYDFTSYHRQPSTASVVSILETVAIATRAIDADRLRPVVSDNPIHWCRPRRVYQRYHGHCGRPPERTPGAQAPTQSSSACRTGTRVFSRRRPPWRAICGRWQLCWCIFVSPRHLLSFILSPEIVCETDELQRFFGGDKAFWVHGFCFLRAGARDAFWQHGVTFLTGVDHVSLFPALSPCRVYFFDHFRSWHLRVFAR